MKKAYSIFAIVLVLLVVGYIVVRSYVSSQAEQAQRRELKQMVESQLNDYKITVDSRIDESEQKLLARIDSLSEIVEEPPGLPAGLDTLVDSMSLDTAKASPPAVPDSLTPQPDTAKADTVVTTATADTVDSTVPTEQDNEIYIRYLKKRWALPTDLTKYELAVAKQEAMADVGKAYKLNADEVLRVIDKVYDYRKSHKKKK